MIGCWIISLTHFILIKIRVYIIIQEVEWYQIVESIEKIAKNKPLLAIQQSCDLKRVKLHVK